MKDGRLYVRLSKGDKEQLLEMSKPYGGVGEFLVQVVLSVRTEKWPLPTGGTPVRPGGLVKSPIADSITCPGCGKPTRYCTGSRVGCVNKKGV